MESTAFRSGLRRLLYPAVNAALPANEENGKQLVQLLNRLELTPDDCQVLPWGRRTFNGRFVDVASGEVMVEEVDVEIPGPLPFQWKRLYRSNKLTSAPLSFGWRHSYDFALLEDQASGRVVIRLPDNRGVLFPVLAKGEPYLHRTEKLELSYDDHGYRLRGTDGLDYRFAQNPGGHICRLISVESPHLPCRIQFSYTSAGHLQRITDDFQRVIDVTTDSQGCITRLAIAASGQSMNAFTLVAYGYDETHNLTDVLVSGKRTAQYSYRQNRLIRLTDRFGQSAFFTYEKVETTHRCHTVKWNERAVALRLQYLPDEGRTLVTDSADRVRQYTHEAGVVQRFISEGGQQRVWFFNEYGELLSEQDTLGNATFYTYDPKGNRIETAWPDGGQMRMQYNDDGQLTELVDRANGIWQWSYAENGQLLACLNPVGAETNFSYNKDGLLRERKGLQAGWTRWAYDSYANPNEETTETGQRTTWAFNVLGQLTDPKPEEGPHTKPIAANNTQATSQYQPVYSNDGKLIELRSKDKLSWQFVRDAAGRVRDYCRPDGRSTRFHYDAAGRMTEVLFSDGSWHHYTYRPDGWLIEATTPNTLIQFERDPLGRIVTETTDNSVVETVYDKAGNRIGLQSSAQASAAYTYDSRSLLARQQHEDWQLDYTHDRQGRLVECLMPGNLRSRWQYDQGLFPTSHQLFWGSRLQAARSQTYQWQQHQLTRLQDSRFGTATLLYDSDNEPIEASGSAGWIDRWVPQRARYQQVLVKPAARTSEIGWQLIQIGPTRFYYDPDGYLREKQIAGKVWQFQWHESGSLQQIICPDASVVTFQYDALGRRIGKTSDGHAVRWAWDGNRLLHEWHERTGSEPIQLTWYTAGTETTMLRIGQTRYSVVCNYLGQPLSMHDGQGDPVWEWQWCLFGKKRALTGPQRWHTFLGNGQFDDQEAGLVYNNFKYFDRETGLPISPEYSSPAGWARSGWEPPHAPESFLSAARYIRAY
ncbi:DUF6531 domain-containing protein [Spirosoma fluviale]|uniref:YD repeat-containing protein n=1 Tax=Spirosoma fluviale TaxID=1597977 RepID=A0A286G3D1_9BACT|nr:DUF6531 domain-containing protein [Spirosoma fluviale]SOD90060.1 YD repeat-containing protein [Spirosoma fluviale]